MNPNNPFNPKTKKKQKEEKKRKKEKKTFYPNKCPFLYYQNSKANPFINITQDL